jgi:hypothetical protein
MKKKKIAKMHKIRVGCFFRFTHARKNLTTCQQDVFANRLVASLPTSCNNAIILSS